MGNQVLHQNPVAVLFRFNKDAKVEVASYTRWVVFWQNC